MTDFELQKISDEILNKFKKAELCDVPLTAPHVLRSVLASQHHYVALGDLQMMN